MLGTVMTRSNVMAQSADQLSLRRKLWVVGALYFAEGVPFGFVLTTLNFYLRGLGVSLQEISILSLLALAWSLKVLWGPLVDRFGSRAAWLIPAQLTIIFSLMGLAYIADGRVTPWFWVLVGILCLASATQDLAVDAYSIDLLEPEELGLANGVRIGAYRVGLITSGAGLLVISDWLGYPTAFVGLGVVMAALALTVMMFRSFHLARPATTEQQDLTAGENGQRDQKSPVTLIYQLITGIFWIGVIILITVALWLSLQQNLILTALLLFSVAVAVVMTRYVKNRSVPLPYFGAIILFVLFYKIGDALIGVMIAPFWKDLGFSGTQFGLASMILGKFPTIFGAFLGGVLTSRWGISRALWLLGIFQGFSILGFWAAAWPEMGKYGIFSLTFPFYHQSVEIYPIYLATLGESLAGGMGSAAFMAFLMSLCDKRISASYYAYLAMLFGLSGRISGYLGGWGADRFGYAAFFFMAFLAAWPAFALLPWVLPVARQKESEK
jgi:MFS transporter, PAT family, beta-lactamase induction signal transducer AmpG